MPASTENNEKKWNSALHLCPDYILEAEVERRKAKKRLDEIPKVQPLRMVDPDNLKPLQDLCQSYIDQLAEPEPYCDEKLEHYIFEAAIALFFGKDVWTWVKKRLQ
jgi:hypothetical protein